jgi:hypothetical protein
MGGKEKIVGTHNRAWLDSNVIQIVMTLALGSRPRQGFAKVQVENEA